MLVIYNYIVYHISKNFYSYGTLTDNRIKFPFRFKWALSTVLTCMFFLNL